MEINSQAPVTAQHHIKINASSEIIWKILTDINQWNLWNPNISAAKLEGALQPGSLFRWKSGGSTIISTLQEVDSQRRLSWTGKVIGTSAIHVWTLEPREGFVVVKTEESFEGWLVSLLTGMMQKTLDTSLQKWLENLKQKAEEESAEEE